MVAGLFNVQPEINRKYVLVSKEWMHELIQLPKDWSSRVEIKLQPGVKPEDIQKEWANLLGPRYEVADRMRQEQAIYKIFQSEKWWTFALLLLIVGIASLSLIGSLSMLVLEKQKEIKILRQMGAERTKISAIFLMAGSGVSVLGAVAGVVAGASLAWMQMKYGWLKLGGESAQFIVESYPVRVDASDLVVVFLSVVSIGLVSSLYPAIQAGKDA
jgi:ABC-type lipoprotein release transport system permease subunit